MTALIHKYASIRSILILFLGVIIINIIFGTSFRSELKPLDLQFSYSKDTAYQLLGMFNEVELQKYLWLEMTLDLIYPIVYTFFFSFSIYLLYHNKSMSLLPVGIAIFDILENIGIVMIIYNLPKQMEDLVLVTSFFTTVKWLFTIVVVGFILFGLGKKIVDKVKS